MPSLRTDPAVDAFMLALELPLKAEVEAVRHLILTASPAIQEGIKWNSPSFRTTEYFGTLNLRGGRVSLILHTGAKVRANARTGMDVPDPAGLLKWLAKDRAAVTFADGEAESKGSALQQLIRDWLEFI